MIIQIAIIGGRAVTAVACAVDVENGILVKKMVSTGSERAFFVKNMVSEGSESPSLCCAGFSANPE